MLYTVFSILRCCSTSPKGEFSRRRLPVIVQPMRWRSIFLVLSPLWWWCLLVNIVIDLPSNPNHHQPHHQPINQTLTRSHYDQCLCPWRSGWTKDEEYLHHPPVECTRPRRSGCGGKYYPFGLWMTGVWWLCMITVRRSCGGVGTCWRWWYVGWPQQPPPPVMVGV